MARGLEDGGAAGDSTNGRERSLRSQCEAVCPLITPMGVGGDCDEEDRRRRKRRRRTVTLPNATFLSLQSRLIVPQPPLGVYIVWVRVRFIVRNMFTEQTV